MVTRVYYALPDDESQERVGYFDVDAATSWDAATEWNGNNRIDINTRSEFHDQVLHRTAKGRWVLSTHSRYQGVGDTHHLVDGEVAKDWLLFNGYDEDAAEHFGPVPDEIGPGRPEIGGRVTLSLGDDLLTRVDEWADAAGASRAEAVRRLIRAGLTTTAQGSGR